MIFVYDHDLFFGPENESFASRSGRIVTFWVHMQYAYEK